MKGEYVYDVVVVGAGMVGGAMAALLARAGFSVAVVESREPDPFDSSQPNGLRVSAISPGSADVLREAGAWRQVEQQRSCAYRRMIVEDRDEHSALRFDAPEYGLERLGTIVENDLVRWALWQSLAASGGVEVVCPARVEALEPGEAGTCLRLESGDAIQGRLLVACDGGDSPLRRLLGIRQEYWEYGQMGVVGVVQTAVPNPGLAWQRFMDGGPLAFLPLQDGSSSIVWTRPQAEAERLLALGEDDFVEELQQAAAGGAGHWPGAIESVGPRAAFPLTMRLSERYHAPGAVLAGDAAHVVHPLAGQGVNLGLLDVAALVEVLLDARKKGEDIGEERTLVRYGRWRRSEAEIMARGIHGLRGLFMPDGLGPLRRLGLELVSRSWAARETFIRRATGRNRNAPELARGVALTELLRA